MSRLYISLLSLLVAGSCDSSPSASGDRSYLTLDMPPVTVTVGGTVQLTPPPEVLSGRKIDWESSANAIASVSSSGLVAGVSPGRAQIMAKVQRYHARYVVTVEAAETPPAVTTIGITPATAELQVNGTAQLVAEARDQNGNVMVGTEFTWASANSAIATISASGLVTAVAAGTVAITASSGGTSASATVTVTQAAPVVTTIEVTPATVSVQAGATAQLGAVAKDQYGNTMSGVTFTWSTANPAIATVSSGGLVWGVAQGTVAITASSGGKSGSATVTVAQSPPALTTIVVSPATATVEAGKTTQLSAVAKDQYGNTMSGVTFTWSSANTALATVSSSGLVTGVAEGTVAMTASSGDRSGSATVTVTLAPPVVTSVVVSPSTVSVQAGSTTQLSAVAKDQYGNTMSGVKFTWSSANTSIATVSSSGLVTGLATGTVAITAKPETTTLSTTSTSSTPSGSSTVNVTAPAPVLTTIAVTPTSVSLTTGATSPLSAVAKDQNGNTMSGVTFTWASSSMSIATVSTSGLVTAVAAGTATITASSGGKSGTATVTVTAVPGTPAAKGCTNPAPEWIWCDDFEQDHLGSYFEYNDAGGSFTRAAGVGLNGSHGMRARFAAGQVDAGALRLAFGRTPQAYFDPVDAGTASYREVYWRVYVRNAPGWTGGGADKLSRATIFASSTSWAQAMIAHVWSGSSANRDYLVIDPASGTDAAGNLVTTTYNDFGNLRWLGAVRGKTPLFAADRVGQWHCVEARARLNDPGVSNGVFALWVNGVLDAQKTGLNWVGAYNAYGINAVLLENYWNAGSPQAQERYLDGFVVSTAPIGCGNATPPGQDIARLSVDPPAATLHAIGHSVRLTARAYDTNGDLVASPTIGWSSLSPGIATVDAAGNVLARATGTALIVATAACCMGVSDSSRIEVRQVTASVAAAPASAILAVGDTLRLTATALDSAGVMIPGKTFAWTTSNTAAATVDGTGLVRAVSAGSAVITATSEGLSGTASVTVTTPVAPPPSGGAWPNEPSGWTLRTDNPFDLLSALGWSNIWNTAGNGTIAIDQSAPFSPLNVLQVRYPAGFQGGTAPSTEVYPLGGAKRIYIGMWWKPSSNWQGHSSSVNKIHFLFPGNGGDIYMAMYGPPAGPFHLRVLPQFAGMSSNWLIPNRSSGTVTLGRWHRIEWLIDYSASSSNGIVRWWLDGELVGDYSNVQFPSDGMAEYKISPTWGGMGDSKSHNDYYWYDHVRVRAN